MFSDSCFELIDKLLQEIVDYDYSDDYKDELILIIRTLNEIRDMLDKCGEGHLLKDDKRESIKIATKMFENAQKKRDADGTGFADTIDFYEGVYD